MCFPKGNAQGRNENEEREIESADKSYLLQELTPLEVTESALK